MKRRTIPVIGAAVAAAGCMVQPATVLETGSVARPPATGEVELRREVASLRGELRKIARERRATISVPAAADPNAPVARLQADVERLNSVIAVLQADVADARTRLGQSATNPQGETARSDRHAAEIAALRRRIERTNTLLLEVAQSLAGEPARPLPVRALAGSTGGDLSGQAEK